ncbi:MAG: Branched-chain alpha-keto acid dehydrogenase subunit [Rhizobium sp.]|nr:Branched-chain alpha-keto acid dehydrogenase subunit [Rhizobium sp.]
MHEFLIKLPDVGEGIAEAELVEWNVRIGDLVREDTVLAAVMTDKATVEIPSPVEGEIIWLGAEIGQSIAIGSPLVRLKVTEGKGNSVAKPEDSVVAAADLSKTAQDPAPLQDERPERPSSSAVASATDHARDKPLASPAVRQKARDLGMDLRQVKGSGPAGRITHDDLDQFVGGQQPQGQSVRRERNLAIQDIKIIGLRRKIAEKMVIATSRIPHITYIEEIDVTDLEQLRATANAGKRPDQPKLTLLPFLAQAMVKAIGDHPKVNAIFDDEAGIVHQHGGVHIGIATQTPAGLMVPVMHHAEALDLWGSASEIARLADAAKAGTALREELSGSTITISSLGALGGIAATPVINHPEVAIIGVNKIAMRPVWDGNQFIPRKIMNLSSSFDHRIVDGWDAATFIQRIKTLLETPALIFIEG